MGKIIIISLLALASLCQMKAQELNARITINSSKIQGSNKQVFTDLESKLMALVNNRKWTDASFNINEKIDCTMTIIINEKDGDNFKAEMEVQARRPVYNSGYTTNLLNFRDTQLDFTFVEFSQLQYTENTLEDNLTATVIYYIYLILGLDFDSFSPRGGTAFFQQAMNIVNIAQSNTGWNGWKAFDSTRNRHAIITALTESSGEAMRDLWYTYHRKGLDEMAANADRGRTNILEAIPALEEYRKVRPTSILLQMFSDGKLDELISIYSKANMQEKQAGYTLLSTIFPTKGTLLEKLKK